MKINLQGVSHGDSFIATPQAITIITDTEHPLFDPNVLKPVPQSLINSIKLLGEIHTPVILRKIGKGDNLTIEAVDGKKRILAAMAINKELSDKGITDESMMIRVPFIVRTDTEEGHLAVMVSANEARYEDSVMARAYKALALKKMGRKLSEIATIFCISEQQARFYIDLNELPREVRDAIEDGLITATSAREFLGMSREEALELLKKVKDNSHDGGEAEEHPAKKVSGTKVKAISNGDKPQLTNRQSVKVITERATNLRLNMPMMMDEIAKEKSALALAVLDWVAGKGEWPL